MSEAGELLIRHKLTVADIYRMLDAGILHEDDRVELIDGELLDMAPIGADHATTVDRLTEALVLACTGRAIVRVQNPVRLDDLNEPQPDFAILRLRPGGYRKGHPGPADVLLLVEVADSSLRFDRRVKLPLYARFGVPEVWIADLQHRVLETHRTPVDGAYADTAQHKPGERVSPALLPEAVLILAGIFD
jgi:Uma2 family endonuclease